MFCKKKVEILKKTFFVVNRNFFQPPCNININNNCKCDIRLHIRRQRLPRHPRIQWLNNNITIPHCDPITHRHRRSQRHSPISLPQSNRRLRLAAMVPDRMVRFSIEESGSFYMSLTAQLYGHHICCTCFFFMFVTVFFEVSVFCMHFITGLRFRNK